MVLLSSQHKRVSTQDSGVMVNALFKFVFLATLVLTPFGYSLSLSLIIFWDLLSKLIVSDTCNKCSICMFFFVVVLRAEVEKPVKTTISDVEDSKLSKPPIAAQSYEKRYCTRRIPDCLNFCLPTTFPLCLDRYCRCVYP